MKKLLLLLVIFTANNVFSQQADVAYFDSLNIISPGAKVEKLSNQFIFTEGPAADKAGNIYFTDQPNDKIWKYDTEGKVSLFMGKTGRANGLYIDKKGNIIACADEENELWQISPERKVKILLQSFEGKKLNGPNDLWIDSKGGIYFTDPYYQRDYWKRQKPEIESERVYYLPYKRHIPVIVDDEIKKPNGIIGTPDGKYLYVADIGDSKTYRYVIQPDGSLSERTLLINQGSDGMTLDSEGNIYLTGKGVTIYNRHGVKIGYIPVPAGWTANVCFGGKDNNLLFITALESVYTLQMRVKGAR